MAIITTVNGPANVSDGSIARILAPYPGEPFTVVFGVTSASLQTRDTPESILDQLHITPRLTLLTTPVGTRVWVNPRDGVVTGIFPPPPPLPPIPGFKPPPIGCVLQVSGHMQALKESDQQAEQILSQSGWHRPNGFSDFMAEFTGQPTDAMLRSIDRIYSGPDDASEFTPW